MAKISLQELKKIVRNEVRKALNEGAKSQDIADKVEHLRNMPGSFRYSIINEFEDMAEGGDAGGIRSEYYPNWTDEDFRAVLDQVQ
jgi:hypothetical protein